MSGTNKLKVTHSASYKHLKPFETLGCSAVYKFENGTMKTEQAMLTFYNFVVSFLLTAGHDGCRINTMLQLDEGKKVFFFEHLD